MRARTILLSLAALVCFGAAYRFASHGFTLHDNKCIAFGFAAFVVASFILWFAFRISPPKRDV